MTTIRIGNPPPPRRGRGVPRDRGARAAMRTFEAWRGQGSEQYWRWFAEDAPKRRRELQRLIASPDHRLKLRALRHLLWQVEDAQRGGAS